MYKIIIANIIGIIILLISTFSWWRKSKEKVLKMQIISNIFACVQYIFLYTTGGLSGILIKIVAIIRDVVNIKKEKYKILQSKYVFIVLLVIYGIIGAVTYKNSISIFSIIAAVSYTVLIWPNSVKNVRIAAFVSAIFWIIYNIGVQAYSSALSSSITCISSLLALINTRMQDKKWNEN